MVDANTNLRAFYLHTPGICSPEDLYLAYGLMRERVDGSGPRLVYAHFNSPLSQEIKPLREEGRYVLNLREGPGIQGHTFIARYRVSKTGVSEGRQINLTCMSVILELAGLDESELINLLLKRGFSTEPPESDVGGIYRLWIDQIIHPQDLFKIQNVR